MYCIIATISNNKTRENRKFDLPNLLVIFCQRQTRRLEAYSYEYAVYDGKELRGGEGVTVLWLNNAI